jgi:hypothetical protein
MMNPMKIAMPPRFGIDLPWDVLTLGSATNDFRVAISTIEGIRKKVIPAAKPKQRKSLNSITERWNMVVGFEYYLKVTMKWMTGS